ncbi:hypothetical protein UCRPA7_6256 [Phaeoacremonium minimum UCRPA7]|uniref:Uncharacterized protein n=1 Tax=Phaeoacremonium minimum (strain UCR-PA7) TaxID=1286976 RepID=R8BFZ1_PHAM7|nr:hypothetical protein UCRPA7_6256 [Phaeoacremonium minimum UCRPA7]EON98215.1 hypothetical protein UCRPA7_6256 [Phaeoacremonium minimum UCRPA7]
MATATGAQATSLSSANIRNTDVHTNPGVDLNDQQKLVVGSILDHLSLWSKDATFTDPLTIATGYKKYAAQCNKYTVKGIKKDQVIDSVVKIFLGADGKIEKVEDRWNNSLPDGAVSQRVLAMFALVYSSVPLMSGPKRSLAAHNAHSFEKSIN